jgi:glycosyltransferase involved in cell wall biosynthesis
MLKGLRQAHDFTVFSVEFENPSPERIRWVRVPAPTRPAALLFVAYHLLAPICYWAYRVRYRVRFDLLQIVESNLSFGDVSYSKFCHRAYLKYHWRESRPSGLRGWFRWMDHWFHSLIEPWIYRRVRMIVVPSKGLERELEREFPFVGGKIRVISNPVDMEGMVVPQAFDRRAFRRELDLAESDIVFVFVALGHFERKGLPLLLSALQGLQDAPVKLLVAGGEAGALTTWRSRTTRMGLTERVALLGFQKDIRPYLWAADASIVPSSYETFSLAAIQSLAAGLPLLATRVYGVEEYLKDGVNGIVIDAFSPEAVEAALARFITLSSERRRQLGLEAQRLARGYDIPSFLTAWERFYAGVKGELARA